MAPKPSHPLHPLYVPGSFASGRFAWSQVVDTPTTLAGYGITNAYTKAESDALYSLLGHTHTFASLTSKPTTIAGYGITDFNSVGDARWLALTGGTLTGALLFSPDNTVDIGAVGATRPRTGYFGTSVLAGLTTGSSVLMNPFAGAGLAPILQFTTGGTTRALFGAVAAAGDAIAGSAIGEMFLRVQSQRLLFSLDGGGTIHAAFSTAGQLLLNAVTPAIRVLNSQANGTVGVTITALGPTGAQTTIQGWLPISINGTTRYMPFW